MTVSLGRRYFVLGAFSTAVASWTKVAAQVSSITPEQFGAKAGSSDDTDALVKAIAHCRSTSKPLVLGNRAYRHRSNLVVENVSVLGSGPQSELIALSPFASSLIVRGDNVVLDGFRKTSTATKRRAGSNGVVLEGASRFTVRNVHVKGASGAGLVIRGSSNGQIGPGVVVSDTMADGIHFTNGSNNVKVVSAICRNTGDDGIAVVSYRAQNVICSNIQIIDCQVIDSKARGVAIVGGVEVDIIRPSVRNSAASGIYMFGEWSYDTYGVEDCTVAGGELVNCAADQKMRGYAVITLGGRAGHDRVANRMVSRGCVNCSITGVKIEGAEGGARALVSGNPATADCVVQVGTASNARRSGFGDQVKNLGLRNKFSISNN